MAYYYIDYNNGSDSRTGLRIPAGDHDSTSYNQIDSSADTTHFVDSVLGSYATSALVGSYFYNVDCTAGALITANTTGTGAVTVGTAISGMAAGDDYYILDSWKTIGQYTSVSARSAGDIAYVRANQTHLPTANIVIDDSGTVDSPISLIGCNATQSIDPWLDSSNTRPLIDFNNGAFCVYSYVKNYWVYENINVRYGADNTNGLFYLGMGVGIRMTNCNVYDYNGTKSGLYLFGENNVKITDCEFTNNKTYCALIERCNDILFDTCKFNSGAIATVYGISITLTNDMYFKDCIFGDVTGFGTSNFLYGNYSSGTVYLEHCTFASTDLTNASTFDGIHYIKEDHGDIIGEQSHVFTGGSVTKCGAGFTDTTVRVGGATSSARLIPTSSCGILRPVSISGSQFRPDFKVWCPASVTTITIYIRAYGTWSVYPTAAQLWIETEYYTDDNPVSKTLSTASTQVLSNTTTWVAFTTTFTPYVASWAYVKVHLNKYQNASTGIYVDVLPVVS